MQFIVIIIIIIEWTRRDTQNYHTNFKVFKKYQIVQSDEIKKNYVCNGHS